MVLLKAPISRCSLFIVSERLNIELQQLSTERKWRGGKGGIILRQISILSYFFISLIKRETFSLLMDIEIGVAKGVA